MRLECLQPGDVKAAINCPTGIWGGRPRWRTGLPRSARRQASAARTRAKLSATGATLDGAPAATTTTRPRCPGDSSSYPASIPNRPLARIMPRARAAAPHPKMPARQTSAHLRHRPSADCALVDQRLEVLSSDPHPAADPQGRKRPLIDPVAHRLLVQLEGFGDLGDREELVHRTIFLHHGRERKGRSGLTRGSPLVWGAPSHSGVRIAPVKREFCAPLTAKTATRDRSTDATTYPPLPACGGGSAAPDTTGALQLPARPVRRPASDSAQNEGAVAEAEISRG
jgi:hypothetical protein